jgi:iron complex outermembrane recepter protein
MILQDSSFMRQAKLCGLFASGALFAASANAADTAVSDTSQLESIVVTAQRQAERIQDVPFTVTASSAKDLNEAQITDTQSLAGITPGLIMGNGGANVQPSIRGVSSYGTGPGEAANVAMYVDGVYQPIQKADFLDLFDVTRVEVLKGPQGTLFGANATGGAIRIFTREPSENPTGTVEVGYGNYNSLHTSAFVGGPLMPGVLLGSIAGYYEHQDGYSKDLVSGGQYGKFRTQSIRGKIKFVGLDWLQAELTEFVFIRNDPNSYAGTVLNGNTIATLIKPNAIYGSRPWETGAYPVGYGNSRGNQTALNINMDFGSMKLTSQTAFEYSNNQILSNITYANTSPLVDVQLSEKNHTLTQELQLSSSYSGPLNWILGYWFYDNKTDDHEELLLDPVGAGDNVYVKDHAKTQAVFGQLTYAITDQLTAIGGLRYSHEWQAAYAALGSTVTPELGQASWNSVTPRVSLRYAITPDMDVYATYSKGFKSGLFGGFDFSSKPVNPEKLSAYEVGFKSRINDVAELNVDAYYYNYTDEQFSQYNGLFFAYQNAANSHIYGTEVDGAYHLSQNWNLRFGGAYNHADYARFPGASGQVPTGIGGNMTQVFDLSGRQMTRAPRWTGDLGLKYSDHIGIAPIDASVNVAASSKYYFEPSFRIVQPNWVKVNVQIEMKSSDDSHFTYQLWGKNLTNEAVIDSAIIISTGDFANYAPPRTFGASVKFQF